MPGPGEYRPDPTVGITRIEDLPKPKIRFQSRNYRRRPVHAADIAPTAIGSVVAPSTTWAIPFTGRPRDIDRDLLPALLLALPQVLQRRHGRSGRTPAVTILRHVVDIAVRLVVEDGLPYRVAGWTLWRDHRVFVPYATIQNWVEAGGEKAAAADRHRLSRLGTRRLLRLYRRRRAV